MDRFVENHSTRRTTPSNRCVALRTSTSGATTCSGRALPTWGALVRWAAEHRRQQGLQRRRVARRRGPSSTGRDAARPLGAGSSDGPAGLDGWPRCTARAAATQCAGTHQLGSCYPELEFNAGSRAPFGYNWTHPNEAPRRQWEWFSAEDLGANPNGVMSAAIPSMRTYEMSGFIALVIPFFSDTWLPEQNDLVEYVTDYRDHYVNTTNGRLPKFYCVRISPNGRDVRQLCDPTTKADGSGQMTGVVRAAVEEMWNDLKRGHFVDSLTRTVFITLQLKSNHMGVGYRITLMFELTSLGAILPSYDVETRIIDDKASEDMMMYAQISLVTVLFFAFLEVIEMVRSGLGDYTADLWNVMDWVRFFSSS